VEALILAGADPLVSDNEGRTVLHSAAAGKSLEVLELLVERGADINAITISGDSVLHVVAENAESPRPMIEYLLAKGCRLDVKNNDDITPGFWSILQPEALETFLDHGEDPFAQTSLGHSMLLNCVWSLNPKQTSLCLSHRPSKGHTPLHIVGYFGMSALDFLSQFDRSVAIELGFTTHEWLTYTPTPPTARWEHALKFCGKCRDVIPRKQGSYLDSTHCKGHKFLEIPGENWRNLPDGKVNPEGQTMEEFLEGLKDRVMRELGSSACSGQGLLTKSDILEDSA
jgi:hypothetical protein